MPAVSCYANARSNICFVLKHFLTPATQTICFRNAAEARYTNQHCRSLHQYKRAGSATEVANEIAMYDLVTRMLDYDPTFRITLKEALRHHYFESQADHEADNKENIDVATAVAAAVDEDVARRHILRLQI